jgi:hypothetical protein
MRILLHGKINQGKGNEGFVMLRGLLTVFMVVICFAAALWALAMLSRHGSRLLENTQRELIRKNETILKRFANEEK